MKMAILGVSKGAGIIAKTIARMKNVELYAVADRDIQRVEAFAREHGVTKTYNSYEQVLSDPNVELVYVATPHSHHFEHAKMCLSNGKSVLCEEAFTINASQAEKLVAMALKRKLLLAEAIWMRYIPMRFILDGILESGIIGEAQSLTANLCCLRSYSERRETQLVGGVLLDFGIYLLNFACMVFKSQVKGVASTCRLNENKVDDDNSIILTFEGGKTALLHSSQLVSSECRGTIYGTKGYIVVDRIDDFQKLQVYDKDHQLIQEIKAPAQITGYEYEVEACMDAMEKGLLECPQMPHEETLRMMRLVDGIRKDWSTKPAAETV